MTSAPQRFPLALALPAPLNAAIAKLESRGGTCRIVGGSVRDALLGIQPKDFDIEVYGLELDQIATALAGTGKTDLVGKSFAVVKLWTQGEEYDFSIPRQESKTGSGHRGFTVETNSAMREQDALKRRDFTINALLYDPARQEAIDYCGGREDLENRILRHVSPAFSEDPLRVLRAMQFAGRFKMSLHEKTASLCRAMRHEFWTLPKERVWGEWEKWATRSQSLSHGMNALKDSGWIRFFPELNALINLPQDPQWHPEGDAWTHTLYCLDALDTKTDWIQLPATQRCTLAFGVLCHDLGKARCTRYAMKRDTKHWISPGHDSASVWLSKQFLDGVGAPKSLREKIAPLVGNHHYLNTGNKSAPSDASLRRLSKRLHSATMRELVYVMTADHRGRPPSLSKEQEARITLFLERIEALELSDSAPKAILKGRHLIALGFQPGIEFKSYLDEGYNAQIEGIFSDEEGAKRWLQKKVANE